MYWGYNGDLPSGIIKQKAGDEIPSQSMELWEKHRTQWRIFQQSKGVLTWDSIAINFMENTGGKMGQHCQHSQIS
jgi:hypothetical protein